MTLIEFLENMAPLSELEIFEIRRRVRENAAAGIAAVSPLNSFFYDDETIREGAHRIRNDPFMLASLLIALLEHWFRTADAMPPPFYSDRLSAVLRRLQRKDLAARLDLGLINQSPPVYEPIEAIPDTPAVRLAQSRVPRLRVKVTNAIRSEGSAEVSFEYCCEECGGFIIWAPEGSDPDGPVVCKSCGHVFGCRSDLEWLSRATAEAMLR